MLLKAPFIFLVLHAADESGAKSSFESGGIFTFYQNLAVNKIFHAMDQHILREMTNDREITNVCLWNPYQRNSSRVNVVCVDGVVREISVIDLDDRLNPGFVPNAVIHLSIVSCNQDYAFGARHFPRAARSIHLFQNYFAGPMELQALPADLVTLSASMNRYTGRLNFFGLPKNLHKLLLANNPIGQPRVLFYNLPCSLEEIDLAYTRVKSVRSIKKECSSSLNNFLVFSGVKVVG